MNLKPLILTLVSFTLSLSSLSAQTAVSDVFGATTRKDGTTFVFSPENISNFLVGLKAKFPPQNGKPSHEARALEVANDFVLHKLANLSAVKEVLPTLKEIDKKLRAEHDDLSPEIFGVIFANIDSLQKEGLIH